jgi:glycosyltransferase involved in cell wall biosynthesis
VYNRAHLVGKTLDSILRQSYQHVEIVAINDGSTDGSLSVLSEFAQRNPGRIFVIDQSNAGQVRARNKGMAAARGEYIAFLDSDDTWEQDKLSAQIPLFKGNVGLVYSGINEVDAAGRITSTVLPDRGMRGDIYRHLLVANRMTGGSVVVTRNALDQVGLFDESFRAAENWDLWIRIARRFEADFVAKPLINYLVHPGNMSQDNTRMAEAGWAILQKHLPVPPQDESLRSTYLEAYAKYYYSVGANHFAKYEYREARQMFYKCREYVPNYRDSLVRICRTLMGKEINKFMAKIKAREN